MIILVSILLSTLLILDVLLIKLCQVRKRALFAFSFFVVLLAIVSLLLTGDITVAYVSE